MSSFKNAEVSRYQVTPASAVVAQLVEHLTSPTARRCRLGQVRSRGLGRLDAPRCDQRADSSRHRRRGEYGNESTPIGDTERFAALDPA
jgi:hypothetical protein